MKGYFKNLSQNAVLPEGYLIGLRSYASFDQKELKDG